MLYDNHKLKNDKKLLKLERELRRLEKAKRNAPIIPIEQPYQKGWTKRFVIREDLLRSRSGPGLKKVLDKFNTTIHCINRDFIGLDGKPMPHVLRVLPEKVVDRFNWTEQEMKWVKYGFWNQDYGYTFWRSKQSIEGYLMVVPHFYLVDDIQPYMITHQRVLFPDIETRIKEIENKLEHIRGYNRLDRIHFGSVHRGWGKSGYGLKMARQDDRELAISHGLDPEQWQ